MVYIISLGVISDRKRFRHRCFFFCFIGIASPMFHALRSVAERFQDASFEMIRLIKLLLLLLLLLLLSRHVAFADENNVIPVLQPNALSAISASPLTTHG